jgi:ariadne-1
MDAPDEVLAAAGEPSADTAHPPLSPLLPPSKRPRLEEFECQICLNIPSERSAHTLRCGHRFCNDCWSAHIEEKVKGEGKVIIPCMESGCKTAVDEVSLRRLVEPAIYDRYVFHCTFLLPVQYSRGCTT